MKGWKIDTWKMLIGLIIVVGLFIFGMVVAIGHVEEKTSFGLIHIIGILGTLGGAFAGWAFGRASGNGDKNDKGDRHGP